MSKQKHAATPSPGPRRLGGAIAVLVVLIAAVAWAMLRGGKDAEPDGGEAQSGAWTHVDKGTVADARAKQPVNIFIFLIDTLRADRMGPYGYNRPTTPCADELAATGVVFENATAPAPWTIPSVASMFTSTYPCEHNMLTRYERLAESFDTLAERLVRAGYTTYALYGNEFIGPQFGMSQGFMRPQAGGRNGGKRVATALGISPPQPFFMYVHNMEPHDPYHYAPKHTDGFRDISDPVRQRVKLDFHEYKAAAEYDYRKRLPLGTNDQTDTQLQHLSSMQAMHSDWSELYDAAVRLADSRVGTTITALKTMDLWDNTLFIYVADHGEEMGEHGGWLHDQSVYEELVRVPLIVRFPGNRFAGQRVKTPVSLVDLLPTLMDYVGRTDLAGGARGRSLLPLIAGGDPPDVGDPAITGLRINTTRYFKPWRLTRGDVNVVIRQGQLKGIWNVNLDSLELYDLARDPHERNDIASERPAVVEAMLAEAETWYDECIQAAVQTAEVGDLDPETIRRLRAVGYIGGGGTEDLFDDEPETRDDPNAARDDGGE